MDQLTLDDLADKLFAALTLYDVDSVSQMMAPGAVITQNGASSPAAEALSAIARLRSVVGDHSYQDVRRTFSEDTIVEEHRVVSTTPAGVDIDLAACVVVRVNDDGLITAIDEYVDTAPLFARP
jgi:ketosteroid isomerase-like protein